MEFCVGGLHFCPASGLESARVVSVGRSHRDGTSATTRRALRAEAVESPSPPYCNIWFVRRLGVWYYYLVSD